MVEAVRRIADSYTQPRRLWHVATVSLEGDYPATELVLGLRVRDAAGDSSFEHEVVHRVWHEYDQWGSWKGGPPTPDGVARALLEDIDSGGFRRFYSASGRTTATGRPADGGDGATP